MTQVATKLFQGLCPVLVLDDEVEIVKSVTRDLRRHAQVEGFTSPSQALEALKAKEFSVIVSDLKMPEMDGLEFLAQAAQIRPGTQRILLTAFADLADLQESINRAKLHRMMTKPWEPSELQEAVESASRAYELSRENLELRKLALSDALTGVANHRYFWERLDSEFSRAKRYGRPLSLIMADVDDFKKVNDTLGHQKGDQVLRDLAQCLERNRRNMDTVARYGGEEFSIILPEVTRPQAVEIAGRYIEQIKNTLSVTASFGVASYPDDAPSTTELVHVADLALLRAKKDGKACVRSALDILK
jgi:two-component system cell cycle response regulator